MAEFLRLNFKELLTRAGQRLSQRQVQAVVNYLAIGQWLSAQGFSFRNRVKNRQEVWDAVLKQIRDQKVLYLEFGVASGESMRYWSRELKHPESCLHGFDSFEGLPEGGGHWKKGQFDMGGKIPVINDSRVQFFKGWFEEVLPSYALSPKDVLVINVDADLYSSTIFILRHLRPHFIPGTYIYFDELSVYGHEALAFGDFIKETGFKFRPVCADKSLTFAFFQRMS